METMTQRLRVRHWDSSSSSSTNGAKSRWSVSRVVVSGKGREVADTKRHSAVASSSNCKYAPLSQGTALSLHCILILSSRREDDNWGSSSAPSRANSNERETSQSHKLVNLWQSRSKKQVPPL